jgi:hypothetical protein
LVCTDSPLKEDGFELVWGFSCQPAFGTSCLVPGKLRGEPALGERIVAIGFEPFGGESGFEIPGASAVRTASATASSICTPTLSFCDRHFVDGSGNGR